MKSKKVYPDWAECVYAWATVLVFSFVVLNRQMTLTLKGNVTIINPKVSGYVMDVLIQDNQHVKGDVIAQIDQRDFKARVQQTHAEAEALKAKYNILENQHLSQEEAIKEAEAGLNAAKASLVRTTKEFNRTSSLIKDGAISKTSQ